MDGTSVGRYLNGPVRQAGPSDRPHLTTVTDAGERRTTKAHLVESWLKEKVEEEIGEEGNETSEGRETLPEGVYVPDSHKYDYAVAWHENGKTERKYYKTLSGAKKRAERVRRRNKTLARS